MRKLIRPGRRRAGDRRAGLAVNDAAQAGITTSGID